MNAEIKLVSYTAKELEKMINDYLDYWNDPFGKGDNDIAAANVLTKSALPIAQQLLIILKNMEAERERISRVSKKLKDRTKST